MDVNARARDFPVSEKLADTVLSLPYWPASVYGRCCQSLRVCKELQVKEAAKKENVALSTPVQALHTVVHILKILRVQKGKNSLLFK